MRGTPLDSAIVVYFIGILALGACFSRFSRAAHDVFHGGQRLFWLIAAGLVATGVGSYSFTKYSQTGFDHGMSSAITYLNDCFVIPFFMFGWLPIIYFARIKSVPEYFGRRTEAVEGPEVDGDLLCVADASWYFGGLCSYRFKAGEPASESSALLRRDLIERGNLKLGRSVRVEKTL